MDDAAIRSFASDSSRMLLVCTDRYQNTGTRNEISRDVKILPCAFVERQKRITPRILFSLNIMQAAGKRPGRRGKEEQPRFRYTAKQLSRDSTANSLRKSALLRTNLKKRDFGRTLFPLLTRRLVRPAPVKLPAS